MRGAEVVVLTQGDILWRRSLLGLCVLALAIFAVFLIGTPHLATSGLGPLSAAGAPYLQKVVGIPVSSAARSGLRSSDVLDLRPMSPSERYRLFSYKYLGQALPLYVVRGERLLRVSIVGFKPINLPWDIWIAVGGGAFLIPEQLAGCGRVLRVDNAAVANAVGAAIAQVSGESDQVFTGLTREQAMDQARQLAEQRAVAAGADSSTLKLVDIEDLPIAYLPGNSMRVRARVIGDIANPVPAAKS